MKPKKINNYTYVIEKHGDMKVPVKIFANEKLMEKMMQDRCLQQGINVAALPGIKGFSIMMPDAHQGYGFSIGGVAAIDHEKGCISPGGIGFDINCLPKGEKILTEYGYTKPIQDFEQDFIEVDIDHEEYSLKSRKMMMSLCTFDLQEKKFTNTSPAFFMKKKSKGKLLKIITEQGRILSVTPDHPILTKQGMVPAANLTKGNSIAVEEFEGVPYEHVEEKILVSENNFTKQQKNALKTLLPLTTTHPLLPIITKLFGYLIGDGSIYISGQKGFVNAYGPKEDLIEIQKDMKKLGFSAGIYGRTRKHNIPTRYGDIKFSSRNYELHVSSISLALLFYELGYPKGIKTNTNYHVPKWIRTSPLWIKRLFLSGFFGAELSKPNTHSKTGFSCPTISMSKNESKINSGRKFAIQIMQMLEEFDINSHKLLERNDFFNKNGKTKRLKLQISSQEENLCKLWSKIGFSYNKKRHNLAKIALHYIKDKKILTAQRTAIAMKTKVYKKKGLKLSEVQDILASSITNKRFIERHYYQEVGQRISLDFPSFKEYIEIQSISLSTYGCLFDTIKIIHSKHYNGDVYDFNIPKTHSFIANGIIVSNCGVRLLQTNLKKEQVSPKIIELLDELFKEVPPGMGAKSQLRLEYEQLEEVLLHGAKWMVEQGYGTQDDLENCEESGTMPGADPNKVSQKAKKRGRGQIGTLGSGNHFIEIQYVHKIFNKDTANTFGIQEEGQVVILIHCGSRGLGHQTCSDYLRKMEDAYPDIIANLPEKDLIYAPANDPIAMDYYKGMCAAANYAWANRHMIGHQTRKVFKKLFGEKTKVKTVYDVAHNIAKLEEHEADGKKFTAWVHRKGATRAFGPGRGRWSSFGSV